jgi:pyridoxal phosphate enzyme (YggS family)
MVELRGQVDAQRVHANLERIRHEIATAREGSIHGAGSPVEILAAAKYVTADALPALAEAGVTLLGENRAQDLEEKVAAHGALFTWDFIGRLQSRKVRSIVPHVRMIHSLCSESARAELERHRDTWHPAMRVLVQVNVAGEEGKAGVAPGDLGAFLDASDLPIAGLMTMPPLAGEPEQSRHWFAGLRELAAEHGLQELSMGTSQDYGVAVEEGATIVRIGTNLYD